MPLYQQIILVAPKQPLAKVQEVFKLYASTIMKHGGVVRAVENHGIRPLVERTMRYYPTDTNERYFWNVKYFTTTFDASPECLNHANRVLSQDGGIVRFHTDKVKSVKDLAKATNWRNPFFHIK